jgi:hypothetical protein
MPQGLQEKLITKYAATGLLLGALAATASAASYFEFGVWMREIDRSSVELQRSLSRHDADAAREHARKLALRYGQMLQFYRRDLPAADAAEIAQQGRDWAERIGTAIDQQDFNGASDAALRISRACNDCHDNHKPLR